MKLATLFEDKNLNPANVAWDSYDGRLFRYQLAQLYADGALYGSGHTFLDNHREEKWLYQYVQDTYNPIPRLISNYLAMGVAGDIDYKDMARGALPLQDTTPQLDSAIRQGWQWSNMHLLKDVLARAVLTYGDVFIKVVDDLERGKVYLSQLSAALVYDVELDEFGNVKSITIQYERQDPDDDESTVEYREVITQEKFAYYKDDEPYDWTGNGSSYDNPYGFVPVVKVPFKQVGTLWSPWVGSHITNKIDQINSLETQVVHGARRNAYSNFMLAGVQQPTDASGTAIDPLADPNPRQSVNFYAPQGSSIAAISSPLDLSGSQALLDSLKDEVERDAPVLAFSRLRKLAGLSGVALQLMLGDSIAEVLAFRSNMQDGLLRANKMMLSIGGFRSYDSFQGFTLDSFASGDLEHQFAERPVIDDKLSVMDKANLALQITPQSPMAGYLLTDIFGLTADQIETFEAKVQEIRNDELDALVIQSETNAVNTLERLGGTRRQQQLTAVS